VTKSVLILGATSPIAREIAKEFAQRGYSIFLTSRDETELKIISQDLIIRTQAHVQYAVFDPNQLERNTLFFQQLMNKVVDLEGVVVAYGYLGYHQSAIQDFAEAHTILHSNFISVCSILTPIANYFEKEKRGFIIALSSVSGDRGRQSNYIYGSAKGGLSLFLQGLRNRLSSSKVHVMTVKLGFVDTSMTFGRSRTFFVASPCYVGKRIVKALEKGKEVVYIPWIWRGIMGIICSVPEKIFKRLNL
jgi:short-subunit dehydrogenase